MKNKQVICPFSLLLLVSLVFLLSCTDNSSRTDGPQIRVAITTSVQVEEPDMMVVGDEQDTDYRIEVFDRQGYQITYFDYDSFDKFEYEYDDNENIETMTNRRTDGLSTWDDLEYRFVYDDSGNIREMFSRFWSLPDGTTTMFEYNTDGNMKEYSSYYKGKDLTNKTIFQYDNNGNMIEEVCYDSSGSLTAKKVLEYSDNGNLTKMDFYSPLFSKNVCLMETINFNENGDVEECVRYEYDMKENLTGHYTTTVDYLEFDQYGNWIKLVQTIIKEFGPKNYLQTRDIEYY